MFSSFPVQLGFVDYAKLQGAGRLVSHLNNSLCLKYYLCSDERFAFIAVFVVFYKRYCKVLQKVQYGYEGPRDT